MCGYDTSEHVLAGMVVLAWQLDLMILAVFSNLNDCIVLYCIVLYCVVLYCVVLYCMVLYCIVLYCIVFYSILFCSVLFYSTLLYSTLIFTFAICAPESLLWMITLILSQAYMLLYSY